MNPKILSVDDSKTVQMALARLFSPFECELCEARNGADGLAVAARERPDLIILDYNMPVMGGVKMLQLLRGDAELKRTPVIMLTSESSAENVATVARLGVRDYVNKPFKDDVLLAKVARVIPLVASGCYRRAGAKHRNVDRQNPTRNLLMGLPRPLQRCSKRPCWSSMIAVQCA